MHHPLRTIGTTGACGHAPPHEFGSPNGAFPATNGSYIITEITGDWATQMSPEGKVAWSAHPPAARAYPSDTNAIVARPGSAAEAAAALPGGGVGELWQHGREQLYAFGLATPTVNPSRCPPDGDGRRHHDRTTTTGGA